MSDEVMQDLDRLLRTGFTVAAQLAEQHRRGAADADRQRRDTDITARQVAADEARAVQQAARAHYDKVGWADWRDAATLDDWATAYQHAHAMRAYDPVAATAHNRIEDEVRKRYNVDIREALELHLQQVAEDERIRAERDADRAAGPVVQDATGPSDGRSAFGRTDAAESRSEAVPPASTTEATGSARGAAGGADDERLVVIPGEVVSEEEMRQAHTSARDAGRGFGQPAGDAVRHSRNRSASGRRPTSANNPRRGTHHDVDLTRSR